MSDREREQLHKILRLAILTDSESQRRRMIERIEDTIARKQVGKHMALKVVLS